MQKKRPPKRPQRGTDPRRPPAKRSHAVSEKGQSEPVLYGRHALDAALKNPNRRIVRLHADARGLRWLEEVGRSAAAQMAMADSPLIADLAARGLPHQGIAAEVAPLKTPPIERFTSPSATDVILALDQVSDPQNIGACMRTAAAFGATALMTQDRHTPGESGALAKAASGALDILPWLRVGNLAQSFARLKDAGYWIVGFAGDGDIDFRPDSAAVQGLKGQPTLLAMGSEGKGLRPLVRKHCDLIAKIDIHTQMESLNVSNAAAIALYARRLLD